MIIDTLPQIKLGNGKVLASTTRVHPLGKDSTMKDGKINITEMRINGRLSPDAALIYTTVNTPVQHYLGEGRIKEVMFDCVLNGTGEYESDVYIHPVYMSVGVARMSPKGEMFLHTYNPATDGGPRGCVIEPLWRMQLIVPKGAKLTFVEYWAPKGFTAHPIGDETYGQRVLLDEDDPEVLAQFKQAEEAFLHMYGYESSELEIGI